MKKPPSKQQHAHAQKITHRDAYGQFKPPPPPKVTAKKLKPAELDQDPGARFDSSQRDFPQE